MTPATKLTPNSGPEPDRLDPAMDADSPDVLVARDGPGRAWVTTWTEWPRRTSSAPWASACRSAPLANGWKWLRT